MFDTLGRRGRAAFLSLPLALLGACGGGGPQPDAEGWITLFNGTDLTNWTPVGDANWRVEDGAVAADQNTTMSYLVSDMPYGNFELEVEFWVSSDANSGVFLRCQNPEEITDTSCYEVNVFDTRPDQTYRTGSIVGLAEPSQFVYTGGQWNRFEINVTGDRLRVKLNGRDMVDVRDSRLASGRLALQHGSGTVKFRNVRLRERRAVDG